MHDKPGAGAERTSFRPLVVLLASTGASVTGNAMVEVLVPWLVLRETGNAAYAGAVGAAALVAVVISLLFGAALVDRLDRRNFSSGADILSAAAVGAIPIVAWLGGLSTAVIVALVIVGALFDGPGRSAREALRPAIASRSAVSLERTNAFGEVADGVGRVVGPAGAGIAVAVVGLMTSFWIAAALLLAAGAIFLIGLSSSPAAQPQDDDGESYLEASLAGFKIVWNDRVLRAIAISASVFGFALAPFVLAVTAAFEALNDPTALGGLLAAFSIGSVVGALSYAVVGERLPRRMTLLGGLFAASAGLVALSLVFADYGTVVTVAFVTGLTAGPLGPVYSVIIQQRTADAYRGRVLATIGTLELLVAPLSLAISGIVIEATSATATLTLVGAGCFAGTIYTALTPALRAIETSDLLADRLPDRPT